MALIPQQVAGKKLGSFELVREVFTSGVGASYIAKNADGDSVFLTKIHRHVAKSPQLCDAFLGEAQSARALAHAAISPVVDHGTADGEPFVAYAFSESETLSAILRKAGPDGLGVEVAARVVVDLLDAIEAAGAAGLCHGELGPWCVHVGVDGQTRITGFGVDRALVRFGLHYAKNLERLTYAAPERVKAMSLTLGPPPPAPDVHADTFSACVLAWELFSRQRLFASRMEAAIIQKVLTGPIADLKSLRPEIDPAASARIAKGLSREPAERPSPAELREALGALTTAGAGPASAEEVGQLVEASRGKAAAGRAEPAARAGIGFNRSVTPKSFSAVRPTDSNGSGRSHNGEPTARARSVPPPALGVPSPLGGAKKRAQTLIGFSPTTPEPPKPEPPKPAALLEDEPTNDLRSAAGAIPAPPPSSADATDLIEEISTSDGELLVEELTKAATPPPKPRAQPSTPPPAPRRAAVKPRQVTLMGIEPLLDEVTTEAQAKPPAAPSAPSPAPAASPLSPARLFDAEKLAVVGTRSPRAGAILTTASGKQYQLLSDVARGGMAIVWTARPVGANGIEDLVAIKTMLPELSDDVDFEKMFLDEMRVAARISHPNVVRILELGEQDAMLYLVMEWVEGEQLGIIQEAARASGGIPLDILLRIAAEACAGLHAAHETRDDAGHLLDLVHRDINPTNVLLDTQGHVKVLDFGIAKSKGRLHVTRAGSIVKGKTPYLSPEQLGGLTLDRRSDLFSLGALFYLLATGLHPFRSDNELQTLENIALKAPEPPHTIAPDLPSELDKLILRLLEKDPKKRFPSAAEVQAEIERIESQLPQPATSADVARFVERVVGASVATRHHAIESALATIEGRPAPAPATEPAVLSPAPVAVVAPAPTMEPSASSSVVADTALGDEPPIDVIAEANPTPSLADSPTAVEDESASAPASPRAGRQLSPWARLAMLIGVGVAVGVLIIFVIESLRGPDTAPPASSATAKASAASTAPPPTTQAAPPTPPATDPPAETAAPAASESAAPEESASAAPEPPPSATPPTPPPTGKPPTGKPPSWKPPTKPPKKHNPTTI